MIDIEADGPIPGEYSMISFGAVVVDRKLDKTYYGELHPIAEKWNPQNLAVSGLDRKKTLSFQPATIVLHDFLQWLHENSKGKPRFVSDNAFDWMFFCYYFYRFIGSNPFGISSWNLGSLYKGLSKSAFKNFKHLRKTPHTHHPVDDAMGNAEAMLAMIDEHKMKIRL